MHGPPLSTHEVVAHLRRCVSTFQTAGLDLEAAVIAASVSLGVEPHKIARLLEKA